MSPLPVWVFDRWRDDYERLSYIEHQAYAFMLECFYPEQKHYGKVFRDLVVKVLNDTLSKEVLEMGGWKGELAADVLSRKVSISKWMNIEICPGIDKKAVCDVSEFITIVPNKFIWQLPEHIFDFAKVFIASHVIEHLNAEHLDRLINRIQSIPILMFNVPFVRNSWEGETAFHKLEISEGDFVCAMEEKGHKLVNRLVDDASTIMEFRR